MGTGTSAESSPFNFYVCRRVARFAGFERTALTSPGRVTRQNFIFASGYFTAVAGHLAHALCRRMATWKQMKEKPRSARPGASSIESMEAYCSALMAPCRTAQRCIDATAWGPVGGQMWTCARGGEGPRRRRHGPPSCPGLSPPPPLFLALWRVGRAKAPCLLAIALE
jgi:hypothetical protein